MTGVSELERALRYFHQQIQDLQNDAGIALQLTPQMPSALYVAPQWVITGSSVITAGVKGRLRFRGSGTIVGWYVFGNPNGTITFDVLKSTFAAFPATTSICGGNFPGIPSVAASASSTTLTGWTTTINDGDILECQVTGSPTLITNCTLALDVVR